MLCKYLINIIIILLFLYFDISEYNKKRLSIFSRIV